MILLLGIGFVAGAVTAVSPCVLPVLPVLLAGGASGRKPLRIIAGLIASFCVFTLFATWLLSRLGLPQDLLRNLAIAALFVLAATLLLPRLALVLERPLAVFSRLRPKRAGGGVLLGVSLGLVFVPCAGPVLAALTAAAANERFGIRTISLMVSYAVGAAVPMLLIAYGGRRAAAGLRRHAARVRLVSGALIAAVALALVLHVDDRLTRLNPGVLQSLQTRIEGSASAQRELARIEGRHTTLRSTATATAGAGATAGLPDYGAAPAISPSGVWINSPPLTIAGLRGRVVLVDFWTYSCINCLRTLPHLEAWWAAYHRDGLVIVGVHTPEFAFEHVTSNVRAAVARLGIRYPVVQDNAYRTWDNYGNEYWPAEYLVDRTGQVRHVEAGEGSYGATERLIRRLLGARGPAARRVADTTPTEALTPETYLGTARIDRYVGSQLVPGRAADYRFPRGTLAENALAYAGRWTVGPEHADTGPGARLRIHLHAENVYVVLGGQGTVRALLDGRSAGTMRVNGYRLYTVRASTHLADGTLELRFSPGIRAYSFTFG